MSRHRTDFAPYSGPPEDREQCIRDNAVSVVNDLTAKVRRQAAWITRLERRAKEYRSIIARLMKFLREAVQLIGLAEVMMGHPFGQWFVGEANKLLGGGGYAVEGPPVREQEAAEGDQPPVAAAGETVPREDRQT